jgi:hypothetical protein
MLLLLLLFIIFQRNKYYHTVQDTATVDNKEGLNTESAAHIPHPTAHSSSYIVLPLAVITMKFSTTILFATIASCSAFTVHNPAASKSFSTQLGANIREATTKAENLRFGWDGTVRK